MAASATFALKAGVWFRRARLLIVSPDSRANLARRQAETPLIALFRFPEPALISKTSLTDLMSPPSALLASCITSASHFGIFRRDPFSLTVTVSLKAFISRSVSDLAPLGRPLGFPDSPFLNWVLPGGRRYPTS